jgi:hypothetical protein
MAALDFDSQENFVKARRSYSYAQLNKGFPTNKKTSEGSRSL